LYIDENLRKSVGSRVDTLLIAAEETDEILNWDELMNISHTVCELLIPKVLERVHKGDWFDPNDIFLCDLIKRRKELRVLYLESKSSDIKKEHKDVQKLIVKREKQMRNIFCLKVADDTKEFDDKNDARSLYAAT
jgi:hypothetical protein